MDSLPRPVLVFIALVTTLGWMANLVSGLIGGPTDPAINAIYATLVGSGLVVGGVRALRRSSDDPPQQFDTRSIERDGGPDDDPGSDERRPPTSHRR